MLAPNKCWLRQGYWKSNCLCPKAPSCSPEDFLCSKKSSGCCSCSRPKSCRSCSVMLGQGKDLIQHSEDGCSLVWEHRKATLDLDGQMTIIRGSWLLVGVLCLSLPCKSKKQRNKSWSFLFFLSPLLSDLLNSLLPPISSLFWSSYFGNCKLHQTRYHLKCPNLSKDHCTDSESPATWPLYSFCH